MKISMFTRIKKADKVPVKCCSSGSDSNTLVKLPTYILLSQLLLAALFLLNKIKEGTVPPIKGAMGVRTPSGHLIKAVWHCSDCPDQLGLCPGVFKRFHTTFDFTKLH